MEDGDPMKGILILLGLLLVFGATAAAPPNATEESCRNMCGDGVCQEIVCMAIGCPCAETAETCPEDCGPERTAPPEERVAPPPEPSPEPRPPELPEERTREGQAIESETSVGIATQVHEIIEQRKSGALEIPQGQVVSIIAQTHVINSENETIPLNVTIPIRVKVGEREHLLKINSTKEEEIEIEENGTIVRTRETVRLFNDRMLIGENETAVTITPAQIHERIRLRRMDAVQLTVENGNPYYEINGRRAGKLLWLFDVELPIQARVHAQSGVVEREQGPWWAFLVTTHE